ncbi:MAG: gamma carbonic anhydrase family protein [Candidatus Eutrophobiaceae bacterium]
MTVRTFQGIAPDIHETAFIDPSAVVIGDVRIGRDSSVWPMCVLRGDVQKIRIGADTNIQDACILHVTSDSKFIAGGYPLRIGDGATVGHKAVLHACTVGNNCLVGISAVVLDGAVLEDKVMLGAGSLVPPGKILESGYLYMGSPARKIRPLKEGELAYLPWSAQHYVKLHRRHAAEVGYAE